MKNNKKGFTIVELVIVIAVIAILAAVLIPTFSAVSKKAKDSAALQQARNALSEVLSDDDDATLPSGTSFFINDDKDAQADRFYAYIDGELTVLENATGYPVVEDGKVNAYVASIDGADLTAVTAIIDDAIGGTGDWDADAKTLTYNADTEDEVVVSLIVVEDLQKTNIVVFATDAE